METAEKYNALIVLKDMTNTIKNRTNFHTINNYEKYSRSNYQLKQCVKHKADLKGIPYQKVNTKDTSQICSVCGEKGQRLSQIKIVCNNQYLQNADYNPTVNIAKRAI